MGKGEGHGKGIFRVRRILALKPYGLVLPTIHSSIVKAFRSLDLEVLEMPVPGDIATLDSFLDRAGSRFDAGFILDLGLDPGFIQNFKEIQANYKFNWIIWFVDDPDGYGFPGSCDPEWTFAFCWDQEIAGSLSAKGVLKGRPVSYLPLAADPEIFFETGLRPGPPPEGGIFVGSTRHENPFLEKAAASYPALQETAEEIWKAYAKDLTRPLPDLLGEFLASSLRISPQNFRKDPLAKLWVRTFAYELGRRKRVEVVSRILNGGRVFGDEGWREFLPDLYRGKIEYGRGLRAEYRRSSFLLDVRQPQARTGLTQRIFDGGCCGVPVLTERTPEAENLFDPEREIFTYRTIEEGIEKRDELLASIPEAMRRAEKLRERILRQHTYLHRARQILHVIQGSA
jgi:spore maturation protein CgeB